MLVRTATAGGLLALSAALSVAAAGPAAAVCDAYSGLCPEPPAVLPTTVPSAPAVLGRTTPPTEGPTTLPFTGGELVLVSAAGLAAVGGGAALVLAGRRRKA